MKANELIKHQIYKNITDLEMPKIWQFGYNF